METEVIHIIAVVTMVVTSQIDSVVGLRCWQCIADNCHLNPSENYKATQKECLPGGYCQICNPRQFQGHWSMSAVDEINMEASFTLLQCAVNLFLALAHIIR
ncbi:uncharacterized protein LOC135477924 [Liolophura sinensis]|uniref:uncharacterized protein LOC135477924 n=1 Tax=Liolophura sinensis TaxID=3198878 RepID=UPI00315872EA